LTTGNLFTATTTQKQTLATLAFLIVASLVFVHLLFRVFPNIFEPWNAQMVDRLFILRSTTQSAVPVYDNSIVHLDISDRTLRKLNNSYQTRQDFARVIRHLGEMGVNAQAWDFIFPARTNRLDDSLLIDATRRADNVYFGLAFELYGRGESLPVQERASKEQEYLMKTRWSVRVEGDVGAFPYSDNALPTFIDLADASRGLGFLNVEADRDGIFRRVPMLIRLADGFYPAFGLRIACDVLGVHPDSILVMPGESIVLKSARRGEDVPRDIVIPIDRGGNMVVNYVGPWEAMRHYDFADAFLASEDREEMGLLTEELQGKILVISQVTTGSADMGPVPTDPNFPKSGIHASVINSILTQAFLREVSSEETAAVEVVLAILILVFAVRLPSTWLSVSVGGLLAVYVVCALVLFLYGGIVCNIIRPSLMIVMSLISIMGYRYVNEEKQKEALRRSFESYFPASVVKKIMSNPDIITSGGQKKELTVMFTDIKGFTSYASHTGADEIQRLLNEYFDAMTEIVFRHGGTVDKFIGDGLMVFFGDPEPQDDHALRCVRAAIEMQRKVKELRSKWESEGMLPLEIRIGVNTGEVIVGNMGSARRLSYTVLGSDVNLAQRLEANAPVGGIMISQRTRELIQDAVPTRPLGEVTLKGIDAPVTVFEVITEPG
jgi:adenylate cyclase